MPAAKTATPRKKAAPKAPEPVEEVEAPQAEAVDPLVEAQPEATTAADREAEQKRKAAEAAAAMVVLTLPDDEPASNFEAVTRPNGNILHWRRVSPKTRPYL